MPSPSHDEQFPHCLEITIPFPTHRLANVALRSLSVDQELSNLVKRDLTLVAPPVAATEELTESAGDLQPHLTDLHIHYQATTARMLRVAVNGFFESVGVVVQVMQELDLDVLHEKGLQGLEGVQGVEQGQTGTAMGVRS